MKDALQRKGIGVPGAVDALIEEVLGPKAALLGKKHPKRPSRKSPDPTERAKANATRQKHSRSLAVIAQMLHCEGFSEFAAMGTLHWARRLWGDDWGREAYAKREVMALSVGPLPPEMRKAIGEFIHQQAAASFQAGLRIGLMTSVCVLEAMAERGDK